jgi:hypothetical protein
MFTDLQPSTADKIETIVDCFVLYGLRSGAFGTITGCLADGHYDVQTDGRAFEVWQDRNHWNVREGDAVGVDERLVYAASNLIGADLVRKAGRI